LSRPRLLFVLEAPRDENLITGLDDYRTYIHQWMQLPAFSAECSADRGPRADTSAVRTAPLRSASKQHPVRLVYSVYASP